MMMWLLFSVDARALTPDQLMCAVCSVGQPVSEAMGPASCMGILLDDRGKDRVVRDGQRHSLNWGRRLQSMTLSAPDHPALVPLRERWEIAKSWKASAAAHPDARVSGAKFEWGEYTRDGYTIAEVRKGGTLEEIRITANAGAERSLPCPETCLPCPELVVDQGVWSTRNINGSDPLTLLALTGPQSPSAADRFVAEASGLPVSERGIGTEDWSLAEVAGTSVLRLSPGVAASGLDTRVDLTRQELVQRYAETGIADPDRFDLFIDAYPDRWVTWTFTDGLLESVSLQLLEELNGSVSSWVAPRLGCEHLGDCTNGEGVFSYADGATYTGSWFWGTPVDGQIRQTTAFPKSYPSIGTQRMRPDPDLASAWQAFAATQNDVDAASARVERTRTELRTRALTDVRLFAEQAQRLLTSGDAGSQQRALHALHQVLATAEPLPETFNCAEVGPALFEALEPLRDAVRGEDPTVLLSSTQAFLAAWKAPEVVLAACGDVSLTPPRVATAEAIPSRQRLALEHGVSALVADREGWSCTPGKRTCAFAVGEATFSIADPALGASPGAVVNALRAQGDAARGCFVVDVLGPDRDTVFCDEGNDMWDAVGAAPRAVYWVRAVPRATHLVQMVFHTRRWNASVQHELTSFVDGVDVALR